MSVRPHDALDYHEFPQPGKTAIVSTKPVVTARDLSLAYTPGVAVPCEVIAEDRDAVYRFTNKGNLVAVVSNGTAVLGLGDIGPWAGKPVMEGKGSCSRSSPHRRLRPGARHQECGRDRAHRSDPRPTLGGVNLEDIKAPECFEIEERLRETMDIPVFHDDQHGRPSSRRPPS